MYQEGKRIISHHKRHVVLIWFVIIIVLLVAAGFFAAKHYLKANTTIGKPPKPSVSTVVGQDSATKTFNESGFSLALPKDWEYTGRSKDIYKAYTWENGIDDPGVRRLDIYVDNIPKTLGVNRLMPLQANGSKVSAGSLSDNCASFTGNKVPGNIDTPAKWDGVDFLCDLANYERNVIGTSSAGSINSVTLTSPTTGRHNVFFTYTDNSAEPDYTIFTGALQSFQLK